MTLTPSGRASLVEAEQIIGAVRHLAHSAQDLRGQPTGHLKIGHGAQSGDAARG
jgi:DNA-binding transcriptional LysR family regulator